MRTGLYRSRPRHLELSPTTREWTLIYDGDCAFFALMVRRVAPEIVDIVDTTDHAAGKNPFYRRTG